MQLAFSATASRRRRRAGDFPPSRLRPAGLLPFTPVSLVVGVAPGGATGILARVVGAKMSENLKQPVIVENRAGASGSIAADYVARSAPNGSTLLITTAAFAMVPPLYKSLPYSPVKDFAPVGMLVMGSFAFTVNPSVLPVRTFAEFLAAVKSSPGKYNYGTPGNGTAHHFGMELMKQHFGIDVVHVPYKGAGGMITDLVSGQVHMVLMPIPAAIPHVKTGKVRLVAVTGSSRSPAAPDTPTFREQGTDYMDRVDGWTGVLAPAATPRNMVARLNQELKAVMEMPQIQELVMRDGGTALALSTPEEFAEVLKADIARWTKLAADAKISAD
jgi:tripartite-type tricarboxylate transporter receptor subunit TctC